MQTERDRIRTWQSIAAYQQALITCLTAPAKQSDAIDEPKTSSPVQQADASR